MGSKSIYLIHTFGRIKNSTVEYIGQRISIKDNENAISIVILPLRNKLKTLILFIWFSLWTLAGIIIGAEYFTITHPDTKVAVLVWLTFWAYFEYKIFKSFMWRKYGVEKIKLKAGKLFYKRDVAGKGKVKIYEYDFIKDLGYVESLENSISEILSNSYWAVGAERASFLYYGRTIKFGLQLEEADAKQLVKKIKFVMNHN